MGYVAAMYGQWSGEVSYDVGISPAKTSVSPMMSLSIGKMEIRVAVFVVKVMQIARWCSKSIDWTSAFQKD